MVSKIKKQNKKTKKERKYCSNHTGNIILPAILLRVSVSLQFKVTLLKLIKVKFISIFLSHRQVLTPLE